MTQIGKSKIYHVGTEDTEKSESEIRRRACTAKDQVISDIGEKAYRGFARMNADQKKRKYQIRVNQCHQWDQR